MDGSILLGLGALTAVLGGAFLFGRLVDWMVGGAQAASTGPDGLETGTALELEPGSDSGSSTRD